ncbi:MAG: hypothetical protein EOM25_04890 [Deltaproteobacteria bacterium]|nr:hypothetical protein [Deltaproteobacteria bacterium]
MNIRLSNLQSVLTSADHIRHDAEHHCLLLSRLIEDSEASDKTGALDFLRVDDSVRVKRLRKAIHRAIIVLEESRKSFKSKNLETLRKQLIDVLADNT